MTYRISCKTSFDITSTGVRNHYKGSTTPYRTLDGQMISTAADWNKARNQQRNWETINQLISLRTLPENISTPACEDGWWTFEFTIDSIETLSTDTEVLGYLLQDCQDVPMVSNLDEQKDNGPFLISRGNNANISFQLIQ